MIPVPEKTTAGGAEGAWRWQAHGIVHRGMVRTNNEDAILVDPQHGLLAVADGVGGRPDGEVASGRALAALGEACRVQGRSLLEAGRIAHEAVLKLGGGREEHLSPATTLTALRWTGGSVELLHAGDSALFLCREGRCTRLTGEHARVIPVKDSSGRVMWNRTALTCWLGMHAPFTPDFSTFEPQPGDRLLLCTDGLTKLVHDDELSVVAGSRPTARLLAEGLITMANLRGGTDNVSVVAVVVIARHRPA